MLFSLVTAQFPSKPTNLNIANITSTVVWFTWTAPTDEGDGGVIQYSYNIAGPDNIVRNKTVQKHTFAAHETKLKPYSTYHLSIVARNQHGFSEKTTKIFHTEEAGRSAKNYGNKNDLP